MRVFVTGPTGFVGSAVVSDLIAAGHQVLGLARSDASAAALSRAGAEVHRGDLADLDSLRAGAADADGVIHTAFNHDFSNFEANCDMDRRAIEAIGMSLSGSDRPFVVTSGVAFLAANRVATESDTPAPPSTTYPRASEAAAAAMASHGVRASVVRLPPSVHGDGDHGFVPRLIDIARRSGVSAYIGEGLNRWPAVHRLDAARVYRLVLEQGKRPAQYHATSEEGIPFREIARIIGQRLGVRVSSKSGEEAQRHFGGFALFASMDVPASSEQTQVALGWKPTGPGLIADIDQPSYFNS